MDYDLIILGAGPAGLTAGIYAAMRKLKATIIEAEEPGGQPMSIYPGKGIANYPGIENLEGRELAGRLIAHALAAGCEIRSGERVVSLRDEGEGLRVETDKGSYTCKAVIVSTGAGQNEPKKLGVKGEDRLANKGVFYKMPDKSELRGKRIVFVGGGNSALEMALMACEVADVCLVHRRETFRADACFVERLEPSRVKTYLCSELVEIKGEDKVESVVIKTLNPPTMEELPTDMVIINIGFALEQEDAAVWGANVENGMVTVDSEMKTSRKGVFACGDIAAYPGKYKQIVIACGEGATAANSAHRFIQKAYWA
ncbi:MAG: NAD(P)/FAD-dependent oxidoreductase [Methanomassiliicoccales archaeon]|jgi:thioredoxin reductase (NADPH)